MKSYRKKRGNRNTKRVRKNTYKKGGGLNQDQSIESTKNALRDYSTEQINELAKQIEQQNKILEMELTKKM